MFEKCQHNRSKSVFRIMQCEIYLNVYFFLFFRGANMDGNPITQYTMHRFVYTLNE